MVGRSTILALLDHSLGFVPSYLFWVILSPFSGSFFHMHTLINTQGGLRKISVILSASPFLWENPWAPRLPADPVN